mgnify:CR=1 FL=1|tara:strand:- start:276 stop:1091 length:816 start_codon:yes stop_codon:yes gene_type:complete
MAINVTPIPKLTAMAAPAFTLGTANAAGDAVTAVASNSTILAFDVTAPVAVGVAAVGTAVTAPRRDHSHAGVTGAGTVVDEAITRFNGTGGSSFQGYSSLAPTISDAGIISLTSGALKFPATVIASSDANTLNDFEIGTWSPGISDDSSDSGTSQGQGYHAVNVGYYERIGRQVFITGRLLLTSIGSLVGGQDAKLTGLPFPINSSTYSALNCGSATGLAITAGSSVSVLLQGSLGYGNIQVWSATTGSSAMTVTQVSADGGLIFQGSYPV